MAARALPALLYGPNHPYAATGIGDTAAVKALTKDDLVGFQQRWLRPDNMKIFVVSSLPLAELMPRLEARFGTWAAPAVARGVKNFTAPPQRPAAQRIVLIDRPDRPSRSSGWATDGARSRGNITQSVAPARHSAATSSHASYDLRETRGWSYGVNGTVGYLLNASPYIVNAPVQADRTADSIKALNDDIREFLTKKGLTDEELARAVSNNVQALPGRFETSNAVLTGMITNDLYGRPDNYYELLGDRYRAVTRAGADQALRSALDPKGFVWVVVGDAAKIRPQLDKLKIPVEVMEVK